MKYIVFGFLLLILLLAGCKNETEKVSVEVVIEQLEDSLPAIQTKKQLVSFLSHQPGIRDLFLGRQAYPSDSIFINELFKRFTNPHIDTLAMETRRVFGDLADVKEQFREAFANMKSQYPDFRSPRIQTVISGFETDLYVSDTLIIIGLDYFLGPGAKFKPNMFEYMLTRYKKQFIVPSVMLLYGIDSRYNTTDLNDRSVLADMIAFGKAYYFARQMIPSVPDSIFIGYSPAEWYMAKTNEDLIYAHFIDKEILYATGRETKQKYLDERPKTLEVAQNCPGRIGTWMGWQIVNAYAKRNNNKKLAEIMSVSSAQKLFKDSGYKPDQR